MADKKQSSTKKEEAIEEKAKVCFVIMPISDLEGYDIGHFRRVYDHIIKPACHNAGFKPIRADDFNTTNHIIIDILKSIVEADMSICDLSGRNPNVLYELGVRQAFNLPVTLIKDERTSRIFDIQTLRDVPYDSNLRIDKIEEAVPEITAALESTYKDNADNINSIVQLLGIEAAKVTKTEVSDDTNLLLEAINGISKRLYNLEDRNYSRSVRTSAAKPDFIRGISVSILKDVSKSLESQRIEALEIFQAEISREFNVSFSTKNGLLIFKILFETPINDALYKIIFDNVRLHFGSRSLLFEPLS